MQATQPPALTDFLVGASPIGQTDRLYSVGHLLTSLKSAGVPVVGGGHGPSAALSTVNDTNITATLSGSPTNALLNPVTVTMGWSGQLAVSRGGTGAGSFAANGVLFGNGTGAIQADSGFTYTAGSGAASLTTVLNVPAINTATTFKITKGASNLADYSVSQADCWTFFSESNFGLIFTNYFVAVPLGGSTGEGFFVNTAGVAGTAILDLGVDPVNNTPYLGFAGTNMAAPGDTLLNRQATGVWGMQNGTIASPAGLWIYNTSDARNMAPSANYERGIFTFARTTNTLSIGTEAGGTGTVRNLEFVFGSNRRLDFNITNNGNWTVGGLDGFISGYFTSNLVAGGNEGGYYLAVAADGANARAALALDASDLPGLYFGPGGAGGGGNFGTDTGITRSSAGVLAVGNGSHGNITGQLSLGLINLGSVTNQTLDGNFTTGALQINGLSATTASLAIARWNATSTNASSPGLVMARSRGASIGTHAAVISNDRLLALWGNGDDGTNFQTAGRIEIYVDAAVSAGIVPGRISFSPANASGVLTEAQRIDSAGKTILGGGNYASALWAYKTVDNVQSPTNFELAVFDWVTSPGNLTIGTIAGGTGLTRNLQVVVGGTRQLDFGITYGGCWTGEYFVSNGASGAANGYFVASATETDARATLALDAGNHPYLGLGPGGSTPSDTFINRQAAGVFGIGTSSTNTSGSLTATTFTASRYTLLAGTTVLGAQGGSPNYTNIFPPASVTTGGLIQVGDSGDPTVYVEAASGLTVANRAGSINYGTITSAGVASTAFSASAGTASVAPINLTAGTNLTTAAAGAIEFDGTSFYATSVASSRQVVNTEQVQVLSTTRTLANNTSAQAIFNATANGAITLAGSTTYEFELSFAVSGLSTSTHTISLGFGGTATLTSIQYTMVGGSATAAATVVAAGSMVVQVATATALTAAAQTTNNFQWHSIRGVVRVNAGGTFIPQITQNTNSAAAVIQANSFFRCWPIGSGTVTNVGNWS